MEQDDVVVFAGYTLGWITRGTCECDAVQAYSDLRIPRSVHTRASYDVSLGVASSAVMVTSSLPYCRSATATRRPHNGTSAFADLFSPGACERSPHSLPLHRI